MLRIYNCFTKKYVKLCVYSITSLSRWYDYQDKMFATYRNIGFAIIAQPYWFITGKLMYGIAQVQHRTCARGKYLLMLEYPLIKRVWTHKYSPAINWVSIYGWIGCHAPFISDYCSLSKASSATLHLSGTVMHACINCIKWKITAESYQATWIAWWVMLEKL